MRKKKSIEPKGLDPLTVGLAGVLLLASFCSFRVYQAADSVLDLAVDKDTYVAFVVEHADGKKDIQSDNERLAEEVNQGREKLMDAQTQALGMMIACGLIGTALGIRTYRQTKRP
jgi:predicted histidine transporter YuiF (NhaC family)